MSEEDGRFIGEPDGDEFRDWLVRWWNKPAPTVVALAAVLAVLMTLVLGVILGVALLQGEVGISAEVKSVSGFVVVVLMTVVSAMLLGVVDSRFSYERQRRSLEERQQVLEKRVEVETGEKLAAAQAEIADLREAVSRSIPSVRFDAERTRAAQFSAVMFAVGLAVVTVVIGVGLVDWLGNDEVESLSTPDALARIAVVGAAFYLAGQLFRRSAVLNIRAQEFRRAAIAMEVTDSLAESIPDQALRSEFRRKVYEHHLTGVEARRSGADSSDFVSVVEA